MPKQCVPSTHSPTIDQSTKFQFKKILQQPKFQTFSSDARFLKPRKALAAHERIPRRFHFRPTGGKVRKRTGKETRAKDAAQRARHLSINASCLRGLTQFVRAHGAKSDNDASVLSERGNRGSKFAARACWTSPRRTSKSPWRSRTWHCVRPLTRSVDQERRT